jgi:hypothetical protein
LVSSDGTVWVYGYRSLSLTEVATWLFSYHPETKQSSTYHDPVHNRWALGLGEGVKGRLLSLRAFYQSNKPSATDILMWRIDPEGAVPPTVLSPLELGFGPDLARDENGAFWLPTATPQEGKPVDLWTFNALRYVPADIDPLNPDV